MTLIISVYFLPHEIMIVIGVGLVKVSLALGNFGQLSCISVEVFHLPIPSTQVSPSDVVELPHLGILP